MLFLMGEQVAEKASLLRTSLRLFALLQKFLAYLAGSGRQYLAAAVGDL